jgi:hypothetical protein
MGEPAKRSSSTFGARYMMCRRDSSSSVSQPTSEMPPMTANSGIAISVRRVTTRA